MSLGGRDDIYPAVSAYRTPTPASDGRNRYAEIMSQFGQAQPFSFFGYPEGYTGGFTPYQRAFTPQPALPVEGTTSATAGGGGGGRGLQEGPSAWSQMTPAERAAYYAANPTEASIALGMQNYFTTNPLVFLSKLTNPDAFYDSRLEKLGLDPESFAYGPPDPNFSSQAAAAARQEALQGAITAANAEGAGLVANPMAQDPAQRAQAANEAEIQSLLNRYPALVAPPAPVVTAPIVEAPAPVVTAPIVEAPAITEGLLSTPQEVAANEAEIQSLLNRYPALVAPPAPVIEAPTPVVAPAPAPTPAYVAPAPAPVQMVNVTERWNGEDAPDPGQGWTRFNMGRGEVGYERTVSVPVSGGGGGGGGGDGLGNPGSSFGFVQAPGERGRPGSDGGGDRSNSNPGDPGRGGGGGHFAKGGYVSMQHLGGPDPDGPDDGYAALKDGEFVINDKAVKKYGIELMNLINSGKISKGKLRGLLEM